MPFKKLFEQHLDVNQELNVDEKLTAEERLVLTTKWIGKSWKCVQKQNDLIKHSFQKCSLSNNLDGREDALINIKGIESYKIPLPENEFRMIEETDSEDDHYDDKFEESSSESDSDSE